MQPKGRWYLICVGVVTFLAAPAFGFKLLISIKPTIPGLRIHVYHGEVTPVIERLRRFPNVELLERIKGAYPLTGTEQGEKAREPKIEMFAAYVNLLERHAITAQEEERIISIAMSEPSIVVSTSMDFSSLRSREAQLSDEQRNLADEQRQFRDEQVQSLESRPAWSRINVQASGIEVGWLYASLDEDHLKPGQTTELTVSFVPLPSPPATQVVATYALRLTLPGDDPRFTVTSRVGEEPTRRIIEGGTTKPAFWHFRLALASGFPDKVSVKPQASLLRLQDGSPTTIVQEEMPAKELELYLYRKAEQPGWLVVLLVGGVLSLITGASVSLFSNSRQERKEHKTAIDQLIDELEFNSRVIDRGAESADILRDSSAGKLSFLPKELRGEINSVYGLLSSAKKLGESLKKDQAESAPRDFGQLDSTFAQLRALIPPILQRLLKEAPKKP